MKISIIVPVYNTEKYIDECIQSVIAQTYNDYELILVDDGSTDNSGKICDSYAEINPRINAFHKANSGQIDTRCCGVSHSCGEIIMFLDADDILAPYALQTVKDKFDQYDCDMVIFSYNTFEKTPCSAKCPSNLPSDIYINDKKDLYKKIFSTEQYNSVCSKAVRRSLANSKPSPEVKSVRYGEDLLQTIDIIKQAPKTVFISDVLYHYRINPSSLTRSLQPERYAADIVSVRSAVLELLTQESVFDEKELYWYRGISVFLLANGIANIARCHIKLSQKIRLFKQIKATPYYNSFLSNREYDKSYLGNKRIVWFLFQKNLYWVLSLVFTFKRTLDS